MEFIYLYKYICTCMSQKSVVNTYTYLAMCGSYQKEKRLLTSGAVFILTLAENRVYTRWNSEDIERWNFGLEPIPCKTLRRVEPRLHFGLKYTKLSRARIQHFGKLQTVFRAYASHYGRPPGAGPELRSAHQIFRAKFSRCLQYLYTSPVLRR